MTPGKFTDNDKKKLYEFLKSKGYLSEDEIKKYDKQFGVSEKSAAFKAGFIDMLEKTALKPEGYGKGFWAGMDPRNTYIVMRNEFGDSPHRRVEKQMSGDDLTDEELIALRKLHGIKDNDPETIKNVRKRGKKARRILGTILAAEGGILGTMLGGGIIPTMSSGGKNMWSGAGAAAGGVTGALLALLGGRLATRHEQRKARAEIKRKKLSPNDQLLADAIAKAGVQ